MDVILVPALKILLVAIDIYVWLIVGNIILSWLVAFNVINTSNKFVYMIGDFLHKATDPALRPIRNVMPNTGNFDLSPIVLLLILMFVQEMIVRVLIRFV